MTDFFPPTYEEARAEVSRELQKRREVFPRWVAEGKLKQEDAEQRLRAMQHAYDLLVKCRYDHPVKP